MLQQLFHILIFNPFFLGIIFHEAIDRNNKGRHKFTLVGNNGNLINVTINSQFRLQRLRTNVFSVGSFKQVLDPLRQI